MLKSRALVVMLPTAFIACAQAVSQDFEDPEGEAGSHSVGGVGVAGSKTGTAGKSNGTGGKGGTGTQAFGGTATTGGETGGGGEATGGTGGSSGGSGGKATGGSGGMTSGGTMSGGTGGTGGSGGSGGSGGTGQVGKGDCDMTPLFVMGPSTKYAKDALVVAVCTTGTPCTQEQPPLQTGKQYEFKCLDQFNCGGQDPGTTNWSQPPWKVTKACE